MTLRPENNQSVPVDVERRKITTLKEHMIDVFMEGDLDEYWTLSTKMRRMLARRHVLAATAALPGSAKNGQKIEA
jgi:predicted patatin/cPLA2 family phospholipase